jgi:hypothetical protein
VTPINCARGVGRALIGHMRNGLLVLAGLIALIGAALFAPGPAHSDCAQIQSSCFEHCVDTETESARLSACRNRCAIQFCQDTPSVCRATDQSVCSNSFRSCSGACQSLASSTSAIAQNELACSQTCCVRYKACLQQRSCDVTTIVCP